MQVHGKIGYTVTILENHMQLEKGGVMDIDGSYDAIE